MENDALVFSPWQGQARENCHGGSKLLVNILGQKKELKTKGFHGAHFTPKKKGEWLYFIDSSFKKMVQMRHAWNRNSKSLSNYRIKFVILSNV
jgi:hypothetical protein